MPLPLATRFYNQTVAPIVRRMNERHQLRQQIKRERLALRQLDDRALRDIGITREDALQEARRSAWNIPSSRVPQPGLQNQSEFTNPLLMIRLGG